MHILVEAVATTASTDGGTCTCTTRPLSIDTCLDTQGTRVAVNENITVHCALCTEESLHSLLATPLSPYQLSSKHAPLGSTAGVLAGWATQVQRSAAPVRQTHDPS